MIICDEINHLDNDKFREHLKALRKENPNTRLVLGAVAMTSFRAGDAYGNSVIIGDVETDSPEIEMMDERRIVKTDRKNTSYYPKPKTFKQKYR